MTFDPTHLDLLVVDDDAEFRSTVVRRFRRRGFPVQEASSGQEALTICQRRQFDVAILDLVMPGMSGIELFDELRRIGSDCEVIMLTGQGTVATAVEAMKRGAYDYLSKPFPLAELEVVIQKACERNRLNKENRQLRAALARTTPQWNMVGQSPAMQEVFRLVERAGPSERAILIQGESGTGKELVARALHASSRRADNPLVAINCAALPDQLLESELFGHEKGAFTGATSTKTGLFEIADGGTLFVDEISEMSPQMQAKVLRVLEDGSMRRVGSIQERRVNVRLISATNRDLDEAVREGQFREDLLYRINVLSIDLPPLRERAGDVSLLLTHFLGQEWKIADDARAALGRYTWPGNVRQLMNVLERAKILADDSVVRLRDLPGKIAQASPPEQTSPQTQTDDLCEIQRAKIVEVLKRERGNKTRAARSLGITRRSLYRLLEKYAIEEVELQPARQ